MFSSIMWKKISVLFFLTLFVNDGNAEGNCEIVPPEAWDPVLQFEVKDTDFDEKKEYTIKNIKDVAFDSKYVKWEFDDLEKKDKLIFSLKDEFAHYVENEESNFNSAKINFTCEAGEPIQKDFNLVVDQTEFIPPEIIEDTFEFELKMPIMPQTEIPNVVITISEKNLDTQPNDITFSIAGHCTDIFEFSKARREDVKKFATNLKTKDKMVQLDEKIICDIQVKNSHGKTIEQKITLNVDVKESTPPNPMFEHPIYTATILDDNTIQSLTVKLINKVFEPIDIKIISEDYKDYFKYDKSLSDTIVISSEKPLPPNAFEKNNYISITIEVSYEKALYPGKTIIIISPKDTGISEVPVFKQPLYVAHYVDPLNIEVEEIELQSDSEASFRILSKYEEFFKFEEKKLQVKKELPEGIFGEDNYISVTIEANFEDVPISGKTVVIVNGPEIVPTPEFENTLYEAQYINPNDIGIVEIKLKNADDKYAPSYEVITDLDDKSYFDFKDSKLTIVNLPENVFEGITYISVRIQATYKYKGKESKGETVVVIKAPKKIEVPHPEFMKDIYQAKYVDANHITIDDIKLKPVDDKYEADFSIISDQDPECFKFENNKLIIINLPETVFEKSGYIVVTIVATYKGFEGSGKTTVIIDGPTVEEKQVPVFEKILYEGRYKNKDLLEIEAIKLKTPEDGKDVSFEVVTDLEQKWFKFKDNVLKITGLPSTVFDADGFITLTIKASLGDISADTKVLIRGPEELRIPTAEFEHPLYESTYTSPGTLWPNNIKLNPMDEKYVAHFEIISEFKEFFEYDDKSHMLIVKNLPADFFDKRSVIWVTIKAQYDRAMKSGYTVVAIKSNAEKDPNNQVSYEIPADIVRKDSPVTGTIGTYLATSTNADEKIKYSIEKSDISDLFSYDDKGVLSVGKSLPEKEYHQVTLLAEGEDSKSKDQMIVIIIENKKPAEEELFKNSLEVYNILEESNPKIIVNAIAGYEFTITDNADGWFKIDKGNLVVNKIDREHAKLKDMLVAQVKTKIKAVKKAGFSHVIPRSTFDLKQELRKQVSCINIPDVIPHSNDELYVVVTIEDKNDHSPVFKEKSPLVIGYPESGISEFVAPSYLVKVTTTDEDIGINAKIRYSVDNNFKIDPENGIIYPSEDLFSDTEFTVTATDKDGAKDGKKSTLKVNVKILKQEHITVLTVKDMPYNGIDNFINDLSKETGTIVKYLSSTALPKGDSDSESETEEPESEDKRITRELRDADTIPVLRIVTYALDAEEIVTSVDFKKKIDDSKLKDSFEAREYENPDKEEDTSGLVAAVSTVSVLLALVILGALGAYIYYIRPRMYRGSNDYAKHSDYNSPTHMTPVEMKKQSKVIDRRPTGFPTGFRPEDLDDEDTESIKDEKPKLDIFDENDYTEVIDKDKEPERKKSIVKFDQNVTEIEIEKL